MPIVYLRLEIVRGGWEMYDKALATNSYGGLTTLPPIVALGDSFPIPQSSHAILRASFLISIQIALYVVHSIVHRTIYCTVSFIGWPFGLLTVCQLSTCDWTSYVQALPTSSAGSLPIPPHILGAGRVLSHSKLLTHQHII